MSVILVRSCRKRERMCVRMWRVRVCHPLLRNDACMISTPCPPHRLLLQPWVSWMTFPAPFPLSLENFISTPIARACVCSTFWGCNVLVDLHPHPNPHSRTTREVGRAISFRPLPNSTTSTLLKSS